MAQLEIACFTAESAYVAQAAHADRIELCSDRAVGGVTPDLEILATIKAEFATMDSTIPVFVMIRPRGGDFVYTDVEFEVMKRSMNSFADAGADGFVFGILTADGEVDAIRNQQLVQLADGKPCTFHRAFDGVPGFEEALEVVIECGFKNILTAGSTDSRGALAGISAIKTLVDKAKDRVSIIPGGGVRSDNVRTLCNNTGAKWYHSSGIVHDEELANGTEIRQLRQIVQQQA